jgi:hypothetical protein
VESVRKYKRLSSEILKEVLSALEVVVSYSKEVKLEAIGVSINWNVPGFENSVPTSMDIKSEARDVSINRNGPAEKPSDGAVPKTFITVLSI